MSIWKKCRLLVVLNSSSRVSDSRTGRPVLIDRPAAIPSYSEILDFDPKPPPTATWCTSTWSGCRSRTCASSFFTK
jgi:hypothetical protein